MAQRRASKRASRRGPKHPGVVLLPAKPERRIGWRARFVDPDTGRSTRVSLPAELTADGRQEWAVDKSKALQRRRFELEAGAPRATGGSLADAVGRYYEDHPHLRPRTRQIYKAATAKLLAAAPAGADELTGPALLAVRGRLVKERRTVRAKGSKRGATRVTPEPRAPATVNAELRAIGTVLSYLRRLGLLPRLSADALADGLQKLKAPPKRIHFLRPAELRALLDAALAHDFAVFKATRAEHAARTPGVTARYTPIAPMIAVALITGMRFGALLALEWGSIELEGLGEIAPPSGSLTKRTGVVGLEISPALRSLLEAMPGKRGSVFGLKRDEAKAALRRLAAEYGAPAGSSWQAFRRTCGCYLTNAPGIFGAASAYRSAKQLGHSVAVAERHYVDVIRTIPAEARTVEAAMQIETQMIAITQAVKART